MRVEWQKVVRENWYRDVWLLLISLFVVWTIHDLHAEGAKRRDQSCLLFERQHQADVRQLVQTYSYILGLTGEALKQSLNKAVLASVPQVEQKAKTSVPPAYCASTDVGSSEPFPEIPERPRGLLTQPHG